VLIHADRSDAVEPLLCDLKTKLIKQTKRGQTRASEGNVRHVEVSQLDSARTSILGRP